MGAENAGRIATELYERVIAPVVGGRTVRPIDPVEPDEARAAAEAGPLAARGPDASWVELTRVRQARVLCPVDALAPVGSAEWLIAAALNNVLHAGNPETNSLFSPRRTRAVLDMAEAILDTVPAVGSPGEALGRHATFARMMGLERSDVHVSWWCGSAVYRGRPAPGRLSAWPELRRVNVQRVKVQFGAMVDEVDVLRAAYERALARLLAASPLTDVATCTRSSPKFTWNGPILALLATQPGSTLVVRALRLLAGPSALGVVRAAAQALEPPPVPWAKDAVASVLGELDGFAAAEAR